MRFFKALLCLSMAIITVFSCCSAALAYESEGYPMVYLAGFGDTNIYYEDDPEQKSLFFPLDTDRLLGNLKNVDDYILKSVREKEPDLLYSFIYNYVWDSFGMLRMEPDGTAVDGVVSAPVELNYTGNNRYVFNYDWRLDPFVLAEQLRQYIIDVKEETNSEKVELVSSSFSANTALAYLKLYENELDDLDSFVFCVPSIGGISMVSELFSGELNIGATSLKNFVASTEGLEFLGKFMDLLDEAGVLQPIVEAMLVPTLRAALSRAFDDICRDFISTIPAIWTCITDEYFEKAMIHIYGEDYSSPDQPYAEHIERVTDFHYNIKLKANDIIALTKENNPDLHMAVVCKYGTAAIPVSKHETVLTDGVVSIELSSFGATCADYGSTLPADYIQAKHQEINMLSPDRQIDASTCLFPYNTWFIKGLFHSDQPDDYHYKVLPAIAYGDLDINSDPEFPQYLISDGEQGIYAYTEEEEKDETFLYKVWMIIKKIILLPKTVWTKIFG
ncbi:MAG: hypothetical protein IJO73_05440 [Clostridia bacterium]|nr:hypothetical protein [Clostridia bacterium]